jgi:hypothetical protein
MGILLSLLRVLAGFVLACIVAGIVATLYVRTPAEIAAVPASEFSTRAGDALTIALSVATQAAIFSVAFALIAAGISEWLGLRNVLYWLAAGMGIALLGFFAQYASESPDQPTIFNSYALVAYVTAGFFGGVFLLVRSRFTADPRTIPGKNRPRSGTCRDGWWPSHRLRQGPTHRRRRSSTGREEGVTLRTAGK